MYATNVCRRDGDVLLRTNTLEDELHKRVPLLLKTKLTSILPPYMLGVWGSSLKFASQCSAILEELESFRKYEEFRIIFPKILDAI